METIESAKKKTLKNFIVVLGIGIFVLISGLLGIYASTLMQDRASVQAELKKVKSTSTQKEIETEALRRKLASCNGELDSLKERMEGIKNADDLLKRDIFLYIDKKFQIIPRTVAITIADQILSKSKQYKVSPELITGIIQVESAFNPMAISKKNARGLMQVMPEWAHKFKLKKVTDLHDISTGIECGIKVLKIHIENDGKGNITKGLYYYVGKSDTYAGKVYEAMGKFVAFRNTVDDDQVEFSLNGDKNKEENKNSGAVAGTKPND